MGKITKVPNGPLIKKKGEFKGSTLKSGGKVKKAMAGAIMALAGGKDNPIYKKTTDLRGKLGSAALGMPGMKSIAKNGSKTPAWQRKEGKNPEGGLNAKGVASYRKENPGSKLKTAVTTKPSKLKPGSKAANRRKSFCARMSGVKGPMKKPNGKPTRKALALRKWNC